MKKFHKILATVMVFTMLFGSVPAWATGTDIVISDTAKRDPVYSDTDYIGINGKGSCGSSIAAGVVNSIKTDGTLNTSDEIYGVYWNGDNTTLTVGSLEGGITLSNENSSGAVYGIYNDGSNGATLTVSNVGEISVESKAQEGESCSTYGIYATGLNYTTVTNLAGIKSTGRLSGGIMFYDAGGESNSNVIKFTGKDSYIDVYGDLNQLPNCGVSGIAAVDHTDTTEITNLGKITVKATGNPAGATEEEKKDAKGMGFFNATGIYSCNSQLTVGFKGNGGQAITTTADNGTAYSIYSEGDGLDPTTGKVVAYTTVNFEDSILSGKISQAGGAPITLNFNNGGIWTPAADDITIADGAAGTITANVNSGGTIDFKQALTLPSKATINLNSGSTVAFHLDNFAEGSTIVDSTANPIDITNAGVKLYHNSNSALYANGKGVTLINGAKGSYTKQEITARKEDETISAYKYTVELSGDKLTAIYGGETTSGESKSYNEGRLAGAAALTTASDLTAGAGMSSAVAAAQASPKGVATFAEISGSHGRFNTGSHVDLNSFNVMAGVARKINDKFTLGAYIEGGNSRYASYNEFASGELRADGDINYFGAGLLGKYEFNKTEKGNAYVDAAFGAGHTNQDYHTDSTALNSARYDAGAAYLKAHATFGYQWNLEKGKLDGYAKYLWSHQNGDNPTLSTGETVDFNAINSHRLRAGFRYSQDIKKLNEKYRLGWYGGLAYEYEFDMSAGANSQGKAIAEPDLKGGSGMAELGFNFIPTEAKGWKFDAGLQGFTGKRDSLGLKLGAWYEF